MQDALKILSDFFAANNFTESLKSLRSQMLQNIPQEPSQQLLKTIDSVAASQEHSQQKHQQRSTKQTKPPALANRMYTQEKADSIMESLMTRIANNPSQLNDSNLNRRIQNIMDNRVFLKLVENTDVFQEVSNASQSHYERSKSQASDRFQDELDLVVMPQHPSQNPPQNISNGMNKTKKSSDAQISFIEHVEGKAQDSMISHPSVAMDGHELGGEKEDYVGGDLDLGYDSFYFKGKTVKSAVKQLALKFSYPQAAIKKSHTPVIYPDPKRKLAKLPSTVCFPNSGDPMFPVEYNGKVYDCMKLKVIYNRERTGYQDSKDYPIAINQVIAGRYQIVEVLGAGAFATVIKVLDLFSENKQRFTCLKLFTNNKEYFDQGLDQVRILRYVNSNCEPDKAHLMRFHGAFYHKEHLFIEIELLKQNLLEVMKRSPHFFSLGRLQIIARMLLEGVTQLNKMYIIHSDLKPQNILIKSYQPLEIKIIDLGNANYFHDKMSNYMQSRSYRAPEVILGLHPTPKIDVWSIGCILAQLWTGNIFFSGLHVQGMLARIQSVSGPWPEWMLDQGTLIDNYFLQENFIYVEDKENYEILIPKTTMLKTRLRTDDPLFYDFIKTLLEIDPTIRPDAEHALRHPFLTEAKYNFPSEI